MGIHLLRKVVTIILSSISCIFSIITIVQFTKFMSIIKTYSNNSTLSNDGPEISGAGWLNLEVKALMTDVALLSAFIIQHSSLVLPLQNVISASLGFPELSRAFFNLFSSLLLQLLMTCWRPVAHYYLWTISNGQPISHFTFMCVHWICWLFIYLMLFTMDVTELLGIKQVYCFITAHSLPLSKSEKLSRLHKNMRHPSLIGFAIIFWFHPYMSLDRLVVAMVWSLYMLLAWQPNDFDYNYIVQQQAIKIKSL